MLLVVWGFFVGSVLMIALRQASEVVSERKQNRSI